MEQKDYRRLDALALADCIRDGVITPEQAVDLAAEQLERWAALNATTWLDLDGARRQAREVDRSLPFAGVPLLLKDVRPHDHAGMPTSDGCSVHRERVMDAHSDLVRRLVAAGFVILGKTSTPEFALKATTEPRAFGPCRNPWDTQRIPGGSSGGSAAAVAAGIVPVATASDGGGSIRIPAAYCGLFGLKPTRGRVSQGPLLGALWDGLTCDHVLTRTVRDSAALLDVLAGPSALDPCRPEPPPHSFLEASRREPGPLRIALWRDSPLGGPVDPDHLSVLEEMVDVLHRLGHRVTVAAPDYDGRALARCYLMIYAGHMAAEAARIRHQHGAAALRRMELDSRVLAALGESHSAGDYVRARQSWPSFARALVEVFRDADLVLSPTTAQPPAAVGEQALPALEAVGARLTLALRLTRLMRATGMVERLAVEQLARVPFTQLANFTGVPACSVPAGRTRAGLPVGVQFMAPAGREDLLFSLAAQLERAHPWPLVAPLPQPE